MANGYRKTLSHHRQGQSIVEFALILPIMVLVIAGIFDLGRAFFASITITNAAREGARTGTRFPDHSDKICTAAHNEALNSKISLDYNKITILCGNYSITCQDPPTNTAAIACPDNQSVIVKVSYDYNDMLFKFFFPTGINMTHQVEMLVP